MNKSDAMLNRVLVEKNETDTTSSFSSSSDVKSDNDESNIDKKNEEADKKMYISRSNSLANSRKLLPTNINTHNHERSSQSSQTIPGKTYLNRFDESDVDEFSNSTENSNELKLHDKL